MELIYCALLLWKGKKEINEGNIKKVLEAAGIKKDDAQIKALVSALDGVDIEKAIKEAAVPVAAAPVAPAGEEKKEEKKEEKSAEEKKEDEAKATAGLGSLFG